MSQLGIKVMINMLGGNKDTVDALQTSFGKTITRLAIDDNALIFRFDDGTGVKLFDDGQSCCETRWMHTDDDLEYYVGSTFQGVEIGESNEEEDGEYGGVKESQFLVITTSKGVFTVVNYNEHNGYYGGFWIVACTIE